jgi:alpha-N-acetylglucosamine transferase
MYSINDTPLSFIKIIQPFVSKTTGYDDQHITYGITDHSSGYSHFNTLRTCNFIFANHLIEYDKVCIVESDMVICNDIDDIFNLKCPSILCYKCHKHNRDNHTRKVYFKVSKHSLLLNECTMDYNGGILLFKPEKKY